VTNSWRGVTKIAFESIRTEKEHRMKFVLVVLMLAAPAFARADCDHGRWTRQEARAARKWAEQEARTYAMEARREAQHYRNQLRRELRDGLPGDRPDNSGMKRIF